jgi:hypothetical protein
LLRGGGYGVGPWAGAERSPPRPAGSEAFSGP